jgi:hypothetical protein
VTGKWEPWGEVMPLQTDFLCPECIQAGGISTSDTHAHPNSAKMDRERECGFCGAVFETIEMVVRVTKRGDRAAIEAAERERARQRDLFEWADEVLIVSR